MQEDKLDKKIASSLKHKLGENSLPYQEGAWEGFQKKRAGLQRTKIVYWMSGIAASIVVLLAAGVVVFNQLDSVEEKGNTVLTERELDDSTSGNEKSPQSGESEQVISESRSNQAGKANTDEAESENQEGLAIDDQIAEKPTEEKTTEKESSKTSAEERNQKNIDYKKAIASSEVEIEDKTSEENSNVIVLPDPATREVELAEVAVPDISVLFQESLALDRSQNEELSPLDQQNFKEESEFPIIPKEDPKLALGVGVFPGFNSLQQNNTMTMVSSYGLGVTVGLDLPGKLSIGSGLNFNYLSQNNESQVPNSGVAFASSVQTAVVEVRQAQLEMPFYVNYPVTSNNSISIQAGFSNFIALDQAANQEITYDRQVAVFSQDASNAFSLVNESVVQRSAVETSNTKFYPFGTLNLGVNLRIHESENLRYMVMPFYNYQLRPISGFGDRFGLFGASFKVSFGTMK